MNEQQTKEEVLHLINEIDNSSIVTQRFLSSKLDISLGKINYLLDELFRRGLISIKNFSTGNGKAQKAKYLLTQKGFKERLRLTRHFLKRKEQEYNRIKEEWQELNGNGSFKAKIKHNINNKV